MTQKIIQIGNSTGVIIPKSILDQLELKPGSEVTLDQNLTDKTLTIMKKGRKIKQTSTTPEFLTLLEKVNKNYGIALKELAQK
ncbi:MAG: hypothetical protein A2857_01575 [Candidatus Levybacteria bacterium RIFCSPHIGHO2_01_FULL_36_15]|nr:MAG: hypothetical protein A2857_01575 [Candidatus Levybacteria bacterium RIFCSPHIGHO2_01_FULL_36_15]OGH37559.1 MAG: hypothetical protein A2905_01315 [Candidatus Levybacteria bacterium RIFCSPLOWO2_01_FULL_36_10]